MELDTELTDSEISQLDEFFGRVPDGLIPNAETLDGFFAALICCPDLVMPSEYMPILLNNVPQDDQDIITQFKNEKEMEQFLELVNRHWNHVSHQLHSKEVYAPLVLVDEDGKFQANDWAQGFLHGTELRQDIWIDFLNSEEERDYMIPIWALAYEHDEDPELRPFDEPVTDELRENLLVGAAAGVVEIYRYFLKQRNRYPQPSETVARSDRKTGRNAPCPCGSGRKFKQCCGRRSMLH